MLLLVFALYGLKYTGRTHSVIISEVCPSDRVAYDDNGEYAPYIEFYNMSDIPMNLKGWGLSDDADEPYKYTFPAISIKPGQAIIAWKNKDTDDKSQYRMDYEPVDVHDKDLPLTSGQPCILTDTRRRMTSSLVIPDNLLEDEVYSTTLEEIGIKSITLLH